MKPEFQYQIISAIRELREANNMSQAALSEILNISYGLVGNIESTKFEHKYTLKQLYELCKHFDFPIEKLFLSDEESAKPKEEMTDLLITKIIEYGE